MSIHDITQLMEKNVDTDKAKAQKLLLDPMNYISSGATMLNLLLTDNPYAGFLKGHMYRAAGQSKAAKTLLAMHMFAEAAINPGFDQHRFIYDPTEQGNLMPIEEMFGSQVVKRLEPPNTVNGVPTPSTTIESFYFNMDRAVERAGYSTRHMRLKAPSEEYRPFVNVLDSHEGLTSEAELKKNADNRKIFDKTSGADDAPEGKDGEETEMKGSYGDGKAKANSTNIRRLMHPLEVTGSMLLIISQLRQDPTARFKTNVTAGGNALHYYATGDIWTRIVGDVEKSVMGKMRKVGDKIEFEIKKNRCTGREGIKVFIDVYPKIGFDDMGSCLDFLVSEGRWGKAKNGVVDCPDFKLSGQREKVIAKIESANWENKVKDICGKVWVAIREASKVDRKKRYT